MITVSHFLGHLTKSSMLVCLCMSRAFCPSYSDLLHWLIVAIHVSILGALPRVSVSEPILSRLQHWAWAVLGGPFMYVGLALPCLSQALLRTSGQLLEP